jgi:hypothetical protein
LRREALEYLVEICSKLDMDRLGWEMERDAFWQACAWGLTMNSRMLLVKAHSGTTSWYKFPQYDNRYLNPKTVLQPIGLALSQLFALLAMSSPLNMLTQAGQLKYLPLKS